MLKGVDLPHDIEILINYDIPDQFITYLNRLGFLAHKLTPNFVNRQSSIVTLGEIKERVLEREKIKVPEFMRDLKGTKETYKEEINKYFKELIQSI
ncbi:hypothetical protein FGO68_gene1382 [Halteria grandinella]|uniref:Uncharacterized protein n=1 Tax=Halteria grandinella TaxID=5974 RepID=A0A8J8NDR8_HALGN|nr:hypothetical protein FGO68_gene1382 [Halteria grandinella]